METKKLANDDMTEQAKLTRLLQAASADYYAGRPTMQDIEFDRKAAELAAMEEASSFMYDGSPSAKVGAAPAGALKKARHEQPALSLDKVKYKDREALVGWLGDRQAVMSWKMDGSTVVITFDDGRLTQAVTRGDGEEGSIITHNAACFNGVPKEIAYKGHLVVRGEAVMAYEEFEKANAEAGGIYENPRNLATATIQMLDPFESSKRKILFRAFELVVPGPAKGYDDGGDGCPHDGRKDGHYSMSSMMGRLDWLQYLGFAVVDREFCDASDILYKIEQWREDVKYLPYPTDGLVFSYDGLVEGWALGSTGHHPRWAMALKWTDETKSTVIRSIEWSVGKTGAITPVAVFDPVRLGLGSTVTRASLHNISMLKKLTGAPKGSSSIKIIGAKAEAYLANMIIPQIAQLSTEDAEDAKIPYRCPACGARTCIEWNIESGTEVLMCTDHDGCPAQQAGRLMNTFSKNGLFVKGLGESQVNDLLGAGIVSTDPASFYQIHRKWTAGGDYGKKINAFIDSTDGWGLKKWGNLMDAIDASRNTTLQRFLYSLNIPLVGRDLSKKLAEHWHGNIEAFRVFIVGVDEKAGDDGSFGQERAFEELASIDGVGEEKAWNVIRWAKGLIGDKERYRQFDALCGELVFDAPARQEDAGQPLSGMTFVITGAVHAYKNRDEFKASVEARGGKVAGSVSKNASFLVNNNIASTSGKNKKAKELGIVIISEDEFISRFGK